MKAYDIFSYNMHISWPPLLLILLTICHIVKKGIIPHVCHLLSIEWKWYTELIGLTRDRKVLKSSLHKLNNLIELISWFYKIWIILIKFKESILIF